MSVQAILARAVAGETFSTTDMATLLQDMLSGAMTAAQAAAFLTALSLRGETVEELTGAARSLRALAHTIDAPASAVDCCGTGGDGLGTLNISTAVAIVAASCGVCVAKHGNRSASSKSGAADVLEALGYPLDAPRERTEAALRETGFAFLMAANHHAAMKQVAGLRRELGFRTLFNLMGPLANPAGARRQLVGVFARRWVRPLADVLRNLGAEAAMVVHGSDGLDEITLSGETSVARLFPDGSISEFVLTPDAFGLPVHSTDSVRGGDAQANAAALRELLSGAHTPYRDYVLANTSAVLVLRDLAPDFKSGVQMAAQAIDSGQSLSTFMTTLRILEGA